MEWKCLSLNKRSHMTFDIFDILLFNILGRNKECVLLEHQKQRSNVFFLILFVFQIENDIVSLKAKRSKRESRRASCCASCLHTAKQQWLVMTSNTELCPSPVYPIRGLLSRSISHPLLHHFNHSRLTAQLDQAQEWAMEGEMADARWTWHRQMERFQFKLKMPRGQMESTRENKRKL